MVNYHGLGHRLSGHLGSQNDGDIGVRQAAHLAYALHNEALALVEGGTFDPESVNRRLAAVDEMLFSQVLNPPVRE